MNIQTNTGLAQARELLKQGTPETARKLLEDTLSTSYPPTLFVWFEVIRMLDNNTLWLSRKAQRAIGKRLSIEEELKTEFIQPKHFYLAASIAAISEALQRR